VSTRARPELPFDGASEGGRSFAQRLRDRESASPPRPRFFGDRREIFVDRAVHYRLDMPTSPTPLGVLLASHLLHGVPREQVEVLAARAVRRRFRAGERVFQHGEPATFLGVVASGLVKLVRPVTDGLPCFIALWGPRQTIGNLAVVDGERYPGDAIVLSEEAQVITIGRDALLAAAARSPAVASAIGRSLSEHGRALHDKIAVMSAGSVERRLKVLFAQLLDRFGDELDDGALQIPVPLSRAELSSLIGATIETTIRAMSRWQKQGMIETRADGFRVLDRRWLDASAGERASLEPSLAAHVAA
jgi:CRP-like cAMP-binding protein